MKDQKTKKVQTKHVTRRVTRSMTTPVSKRLRSNVVTLGKSTPKQPSGPRKSKRSEKVFVFARQEDNTVVQDKCSSPILDKSVKERLYPPEPPSNSSIYSDWLMNHPGFRMNSMLTEQDQKRLDYRFRD